MQWQAAIWITGVFCTSPTGGVEALAGLIPVHLHLKKLGERAMFCWATLSPTHPVRSFLRMEGHYQPASISRHAVGSVTVHQQAQTKSAVSQEIAHILVVDKVFE